MQSVRSIFSLLVVAGAAAAQQYTITTVAGVPGTAGFIGDAGTALNGYLYFPIKVAADPKGNYYIADYLNHRIRKVAADGTLTTIAGTGAFGFQGDNGLGTQALIGDVHGIAADATGNVYISDTTNSRVRRIDATSGNITTFAGGDTRGYAGDGAAATSAQLTLPAGLAVDSAGNVYVADYGNNTVRKIDTKGMISTFAGTGTYGYSGDGGPAGKAMLATPVSLAVDPAGNVYIGEVGNLDIRKVTADGNIQTVAKNLDAESIAVDAAGDIFYPNYVTSTVQEVRPGGQQVTVAGNGTMGFSGDNGPAAFAQLNLPYGIAMDGTGNLYVADTGNSVIRKLTPSTYGVGAIVNAASGLAGPVTPGEIVTIYGAGLGPANLTVNTPGAGLYGSQLAGVTVSFDGINAPILYVSATQVGVVVPYGETIGNTAQVSVNYQGRSTTAASLYLGYSAPGIFTLDGSGSGQAAVVNDDGTLNSASHPARIGSYVSLYITGEGQTSPGGADGKLATAPYPTPVQPVSVKIGGQTAMVTYAGGAPGALAGLAQVNVQVPLVAAGSNAVALPVVVMAGSQSSQSSATLWVVSR